MQSEKKIESNAFICSSKLFTKKTKRDAILNKSQITKQSVWFNHNDYLTIIKEISHINFLEVKLLQLSNNLIESLQYLQYLQAENLEQLHISFNNITDIKALRKCHFPNLIKLSLAENPIGQMNYLNLTYFPKLQEIILQCIRPMNFAPKYLIKNKYFLVKSFPIYIQKATMTKQSQQKQPLLASKITRKNK